MAADYTNCVDIASYEYPRLSDWELALSFTQRRVEQMPWSVIFQPMLQV